MSVAFQHLVFVGLAGKVLALDRDSGALIWDCKIEGGMGGYVTVMLDGNLLIAASNGYIQGMHPENGHVVWRNGLKGKGMGVATLCSVRGSADGGPGAVAAAAAAAGS